MLIVSQNREIIVNSDRVFYYDIYSRSIHANIDNDEETGNILIGKYDTDEETQHAFKGLMKTLAKDTAEIYYMHKSSKKCEAEE